MSNSHVKLFVKSTILFLQCCETPNLSAAPILWFRAHYVFDLEYNKSVKEVGYFSRMLFFLTLMK